MLFVVHAKHTRAEADFQQITLITPTAPTRDLRWGFKNSPNIDVQLAQGGNWTYGQCNVFVNNIDHSRVDAFSLDEVGVAARRINEECVMGKGKGEGLGLGTGTGTGGHVGVGGGRGFYVVLGGVWGVVALL